MRRGRPGGLVSPEQELKLQGMANGLSKAHEEGVARALLGRDSPKIELTKK